MQRHAGPVSQCNPDSSASLPTQASSARPGSVGQPQAWVHRVEPSSSAVLVWVHPSQFPERVQQDLLHSIQSRQIAAKFLYDSVKLAHKWMQLHRALSPARRQTGAARLYEQAATDLARHLRGQAVYVLGLGCGDGYKDVLLIEQLSQAGCSVYYAPLDASLALALTARGAALRLVPPDYCQAWVADLAQAEDLPWCLESIQPAGSIRCVTCFGLLPSFQPGSLFPRLRALLRGTDWLVLSANLVNGPDYPAAVAAVLPQYDHPLTRDWLLSFLGDLGVSQADGRLQFSVQPDPTAPPLRRITAEFLLERDCTLELGAEKAQWSAGQSVQVFVSYRYTPELAHRTLAAYGMKVVNQWLDPEGQEGVFLARLA